MRSNSKSPLQITLSGFTQDQYHEDYIQTIKKVYGEYSGVLSKETSILCTTSVNSQKYKIAQVFKDSKIKVVKKEWMQQCHEKQKKIDPSKYIIRSIFYGLNLGLHGFGQEQYNKIRDKLEQEEGQVQVVKLEEVTHKDPYHCIMVSQKCIQLPENVRGLDIPIVTIQWYNRCIQKDSFVFPIDYAINYDTLNIRLQMPKLGKCATRARDILKKAKLNDEKYDFLKGKIFYLHKFDERSSKQTKQIISTYGGFYLDQISSLHTHILCSDYTDEQYKMFLKYGNYVKIIKLSWLFDCIVTETALPEEDYILRKFNIKVKQKTISTRFSSLDTNSFSFGNRTSFSLGDFRQTTLRRGTSISRSNVQLMGQSSDRTLIRSLLFKNKKFFFIRHQYKKQELKRLTKQVKEHSGIIPRQLTKGEHFYLVMVDTKDNNQQLSKIETFLNYADIVSYRWVYECIKYGEILDLNQKNRFIFKPFGLTTPVSFLLTLIIDNIGFDEVMRSRIRELLQVVGNGSIIKRKELVTHVICEPKRYKNEVRYRQYKELMSTNTSLDIKFVKIEWIIQSLNQQSEQPIDKYILS